VERLVAEKPGPEVFFIQIGAFDGISNDPLHAYIKAHGWRGVLVEPQAAPFEQLKENYRGQDQFAFVNAAIAEADGMTDFYVVRDAENLPPWSQKIASLKKDNVLKHREGLPEYGVRVGIGDIDERMEAVQVEALTFATLAKRCGVERVDLLQVDAEGYDARILAQVDFERFRPAIVRYEHMHLSQEEQEATLRLLREWGYLIVIGFTETLAYLR
jgi:FkbM family methyltransferase